VPTGVRRSVATSLLIVLSGIVLCSCGGGGGGGSSTPRPITNHDVTISWAANHETGVNSAGGGYRVAISGHPAIDVPYVSGPTAPTSAPPITLQTGTYTVTVTAFAALDTQGLASGSVSAASQPLTVNVP
jgi:hypothetical protein